jgi:hypothetical protein
VKELMESEAVVGRYMLNNMHCRGAETPIDTRNESTEGISASRP